VAKAPAQNKAPQPAAVMVQVGKLDFDKENPRFPPEIATATDDVLIERFIRDERLQELVESIGDQGYFPGEPLLVVKNGTRYTVVEGNRRLAALKLLNGLCKPPVGRIAIERAIEAAEQKPDVVHALVFGASSEIVKYLGFRHLTGIKPWNALQKARYMQRLLEMTDRGTSAPAIRQLARETGSTAAYLGQSLTALTLYERAEEKDFFGLPLSPQDIEFSLLTTALSYSNIATYVGLRQSTDPAQEPDLDALSNVFQWLFVRPTGSKPVVRESRQLSKLAAVVAEPESLNDLIKSGNLDDAFELSKGTAEALTESLGVVKRRITKAWEWLPKVPAARVSEEHVQDTAEIAETSQALYDAVGSKFKQAKRARR
jgi:hypothetical protein